MDPSPAANRRKEERTVFDNQVYVVIDTQPEIVGQMIEISATGLAFTFVDMGDAGQRLGGRDRLCLDLFAAGRGYYLRCVAARVVSNITLCADGALPSLPIRRIGVAFDKPTLTQQIQINALSRSRKATSRPTPPS